MGLIETQSKMSLKKSCINSCHGDIARGRELYDFLIDGIDSLPDFDVPQPTVLQQAEKAIGNIFGWVKDNREDIVQAVGFIQSLRGGTPAVPNANEIPPIQLNNESI